MQLKAVMDSLEGVDEAFHSLYTQRDGKYELTGIEGVKTVRDVERVEESLRKEREDHGDTRKALGKWNGLDPDEVIPKLDKFPELEAAAKHSSDTEEKIETIVNSRIAAKTAPLERTITQLTQERDSLNDKVTGFEEDNRKRIIRDSITSAIGESKGFLTEAQEDALIHGERLFDVSEDGRTVVAKDNVGITPGITPNVWLTEIQAKKPHWWGASQGGGARPPGGQNGPGNNPWSREHWNVTQQNQILKQNRTTAEQLAESAGTRLGGGKPQAEA